MPRPLPILLTLAFLACQGPVGPVRVYVDGSTIPAKLEPDAVRMTVQAAVGFWHDCGFDVAMATMVGDIAIDGTSRVWFHEIGATRQGYELGMGQRGGYVEIYSDQPWITDGVPCDRQLYLGDQVRHELGHVLGLGHDPEMESVMYAYSWVCADRWQADACLAR